MPQTATEKENFKNGLIKSSALLEDAENYNEAITNLGNMYRDSESLGQDLSEMVELSSDAPSKELFWQFVQSLSQFRQKTGRYPLS